MKNELRNKPAYAIESVDHALHLAQLLQQEGPLRVTDAADRLDVSPSTAHRLLAMLVYRDFAEQGSDRRYRAGAALRRVEQSEAPIVLLRRVALPHLQALVHRVQETANIMLPVRGEVRFVATVECDQLLRVGDRAGRVLPAHLASGGKAILATLTAPQLTELYASRDDVDLPRLRRELSAVRKHGFAINNQQTETGLTGVGIALRDPNGKTSAALSLSLPAARYDRERLPTWVNALSTTAGRIEQDLAAGL
ncbi:MAG: IclR family transcriptional regulator [Solirubrobacteraceae bacterium]